MTGALIETGICINVAVFADGDMSTMLAMGYIPCPEGYGISDLYDAETDTWSKAVQPDEEAQTDGNI